MTNTNSHPPFTFKTNPAERKRILGDITASGMTMSSYFRSRLLDAPQTSVTFRRSQTRRLIKRLIGDIGRVGNNMNQIAWKQNTGTALTPLDRDRHEEGITALKEMRALLLNHLMQGPC